MTSSTDRTSDGHARHMRSTRPSPAPSDRGRKTRTRRWGRAESRTGWAFAAPWAIGFVLLTAGPVLTSFAYSFTDFNIFEPPQWVGFRNFAYLLEDPRFLTAVSNTLYLAVIGVPLGLALSLLCALALNFPVSGQPLYRAIVYLPTIVPMVTATYVWRWILNAQYGMLDSALRKLGLQAPDWLSDPTWTKPAVLLIMFWGMGTTTIIYLAALKQVPQDLYESAAVDGANGWQRFWNVTWPSVTPVTLFQLIMGIITSLQIFTQPFLLAQERLNPASGGPVDSLLTYAIYLFQNAFVYLRMGYASAMAWVLFVMTGVLTLLVLHTSKRWVHYGNE